MKINWNLWTDRVVEKKIVSHTPSIWKNKMVILCEDLGKNHYVSYVWCMKWGVLIFQYTRWMYFKYQNLISHQFLKRIFLETMLEFLWIDFKFYSQSNSFTYLYSLIQSINCAICVTSEKKETVPKSYITVLLNCISCKELNLFPHSFEFARNKIYLNKISAILFICIMIWA